MKGVRHVTWRHWWATLVSLTVVSGFLGGCGSAAPAPAPAPQDTTPAAGGGWREPPERPCRDWLRLLRPLNHTELDYVASRGLWDGMAPAFGGLTSCEIRMRDAPGAAAAGLGFVWVTLTTAINDHRSPREGVPQLPEPTVAAVDWATYLQQESHTVLRGELSCGPIWTEAEYLTGPDVRGCDTGGTIDGQRFKYQFAAVHRDVFLAAQVDYYYTPHLAEQVDNDARRHAHELYARFAATVADGLRPPSSQ